MTNTSVSSLVISGNNIFAGTDGGVFLSTNNGSSWNSVNSGLTNTIVSGLAISGNNIFAGIWGGGVWRRSLSEMITGIENKQNNLPTSFSLQQNYPNPFNPITTINYSISQASFVTIKVYDVLGKEVATIVNGNKPVGNYSVEFDASKLVSGIYFYRLQAGNFTETKKLILIK